MNRACRPLRSSALAAVLALLAPAALAQLQINSTPNPVGSGARALGMGAAFIAVADDATAASWNPGGLTQLERPEIAIVYSSKFLGEDFQSDPFSELHGEDSVGIHDLNYLSFVYPIPRTIAGRNLVLSINYLSQYDFDRELHLKQRLTNLAPSADIIGLRRTVDYRQQGKLASVSPAFGFELFDWWSIGAVVNVWHSQLIPNNGWEIHQQERQLPFLINGVPQGNRFFHVDRKEEYEEFEGVNYTLGMLFKPTERLSIGTVWHSKLEADVKYTTTTRFRGAGAFRRGIPDERDKEMTFPSAFGAGIAYRFPGDKLTLSFDVTRRDWDQFIIYDPENPVRALRRVSGVTNQAKALASHDPTWTVRLGGEYVFVNEKKPVQNLLPSVRAGLFYDPEPGGGRNLGFWSPTNLAGVKGDGAVDRYYGFSLGSGVLIKNRVNLDAAYIFRFGNGVRSDTFGFADTDADVRQHYLYLSTVIYF